MFGPNVGIYRGETSGRAIYNIAPTAAPRTIADYKRGVYAKPVGGALVPSAYPELHVNGGEMAGLITAHDANGALKHNAHRITVNPETPATQSITTIVGVKYTVECEGAGSVTLSGAGTGSVTEGNPVEVTATTTTLTLTVVGSLDLMWGYPTDLPMADVPVEFRVGGRLTYVSGTTARYLPWLRPYVYNGTSWVKQGIAVAPAATNLITESRDFSDAAWISNNTGTLLVDQIGPDGETSATTFIDDNATGTGQVFIGYSVNLTTSTAYTFSVFAKAGQLKWLVMAPSSLTTPTNASRVWFDLEEGVVGTVVEGTAQIESCGNGWYRCSHTFTTDGTDTTGQLRIAVADDGTDSNYIVDRDNTSSILIYGAQLEVGSVPTPYTQTQGSAVARPAFNPDIKAAYNGYDPAGMSIVMDGLMTGGTSQLLKLSADANNEILLDAASSAFTFSQEAATVVDTVTGGSFTSGINVPFNIASRNTPDDINGAVDGTALTANTTVTALFDASAVPLEVGPILNGYVDHIIIYPPLTDAQLAEAS